MAEGAYKGPRQNRRMLDDKTVFVSKEELADFKRRFGADKTLRDLLNADKTGKLPEAVGAYRGRRSEGANVAPKKEEDSGMMSRLRRAGLTAKGAEEAGGLSSSAMAALGIAGGALGRGAKASKTASMARTEPRVGRPVTSRLDDAEAAFSRPQAAQVSKETGRRFTAAQEREAAEASIRGAAARKEMAAKRAGRSRAMEEAKTQRMMRDEKKKPSPRARTRDEEDIEFSYGGMAKKRK